MDTGVVSIILTTIVGLMTAWFKYNQSTKDKLTDFKIERWKKEEENKFSRRSENVAKIYGILWQILHNTNSDRVYIIQPHPLVDNQYISISLEVRRNGMASMKPVIRKTPMGDVALFCSDLAKRDFMFYKNIDEEVRDKRAKSILATNGTVSAVIKRLSDGEYDWIGSIVCEFTREISVSPDVMRKELLDAANNIQYILPEYKD